jgi:hypothetical protein
MALIVIPASRADERERSPPDSPPLLVDCVVLVHHTVLPSERRLPAGLDLAASRRLCGMTVPGSRAHILRSLPGSQEG